MKQKIITLLFPPRTHILQYSFYPILDSGMRKHIRFTQDHNWVMNEDTNDILILFGWFKYHKELKSDEWLSRLRDKYRVLIYFDDNDGTEILYLDTLKYFDLYYKKQLLRDKQLYTKTFYGNRIFSDYYRNRFQIEEENLPEPFPVLDDIQLTGRLRVSWNLALGEYPIGNVSLLKSHLSLFGYRIFGIEALQIIRSRFSGTNPPTQPVLAKCHARFGYRRYRSSVGYQRKLFLDVVQDHELFLSGIVSKQRYARELRQVQAVLSPFGWGEVCYRDIEAVLNGAVLIKPSMEHLETWPALYQPNETYVPVMWDASDLITRVEETLSRPDIMDDLRGKAWETLRSAYTTASQRADTVLQEILDQ